MSCSDRCALAGPHVRGAAARGANGITAPTDRAAPPVLGSGADLTDAGLQADAITAVTDVSSSALGARQAAHSPQRHAAGAHEAAAGLLRDTGSATTSQRTQPRTSKPATTAPDVAAAPVGTEATATDQAQSAMAEASPPSHAVDPQAASTSMQIAAQGHTASHVKPQASVPRAAAGPQASAQKPGASAQHKAAMLLPDRDLQANTQLAATGASIAAQNNASATQTALQAGGEADGGADAAAALAAGASASPAPASAQELVRQTLAHGDTARSGKSWMADVHPRSKLAQVYQPGVRWRSCDSETTESSVAASSLQPTPRQSAPDAAAAMADGPAPNSAAADVSDGEADVDGGAASNDTGDNGDDDQPAGAEGTLAAQSGSGTADQIASVSAAAAASELAEPEGHNAVVAQSTAGGVAPGTSSGGAGSLASELAHVPAAGAAQASTLGPDSLLGAHAGGAGMMPAHALGVGAAVDPWAGSGMSLMRAKAAAAQATPATAYRASPEAGNGPASAGRAQRGAGRKKRGSKAQRGSRAQSTTQGPHAVASSAGGIGAQHAQAPNRSPVSAVPPPHDLALQNGEAVEKDVAAAEEAGDEEVAVAHVDDAGLAAQMVDNDEEVAHEPAAGAMAPDDMEPPPAHELAAAQAAATIHALQVPAGDALPRSPRRTQRRRRQ